MQLPGAPRVVAPTSVPCPPPGHKPSQGFKHRKYRYFARDTTVHSGHIVDRDSTASESAIIGRDGRPGGQ